MDRHAVVVVAASVAIASAAGYSAFGAAALNDLRVSWSGGESFDFITMLNGGVIRICNPSPVPLSFGGLSIVAHYRGGEIGRLVAPGAAVPPGAALEVAGRGEAPSRTESMFSAHIGSGISGTDPPMVDADAMTVSVSADTHILGFIPVTVTSEYPGREFVDMMSGGGADPRC